MAEYTAPASATGLEIAVVGMAGRFPGAHDVDAFWRNLRDGVESITFFTEADVVAAGEHPGLARSPAYVGARGVLEGAEYFDAGFFGYSAREAEVLDPQQRVFLESAWHALENAGYAPEGFAGAIGVYGSVGTNTYLLNNLLARPDALEAVGSYQTMIASDKDFLATRVAYKLNLTGPAVTVQTACSSSLVAVHLACQALLGGECDMALAGGVSIAVPQRVGYVYQEGGIFSPDGRCRAFDADAKGTLCGSGVGIVVLRRLEDALAAGDPIRAVIKGSAINNDGARKVGYTAPSVEGQSKAIRLALAMAEVDPATVGYIEAHGTGTPIGDPIEIAALTKAYGAASNRRTRTAIGSVKTNVGHLDAAAGVTGLIKTVLALEHGEIPPSLHFTRPNPGIDFDASPFRVNDRLVDWAVDDGPRRAAVSAFGVGGTNAHVVLEQAPARTAAPESAGQPALLALSGRTSQALERATSNLLAALRHTTDDIADVAYTTQTGRRAFGRRRVVVCRSVDEAVSALDGADRRRVLTADDEAVERSVAFLFPGQGSQYPDMGLGLYRDMPRFRQTVDRCSDLLEPELGVDLRRLLYPTAAERDDARRRLDETAVTQPALFVVEYALAALLSDWGVRPQAMLGHSIGEYVAACRAGVFSLEDALKAVAARGRLVQRLPAGAMLAVALAEGDLAPFLDERVSVAAINGPARCVVSGPFDAVETVVERLKQQGLDGVRLRTSHAFHSAMMEPAMEDLAELLAGFDMQPPHTPFVSNVTGDWIAATDATDPGYWARHLRHAVRFSEGLSTLIAGREPQVLLEVGPGQTLQSMARQIAGSVGRAYVFGAMRRADDDRSDTDVAVEALGRVWLSGGAVDWQGVHQHRPHRRVALPGYPFERDLYWIEPNRSDAPAHGHRPAGRRPDVADWFYLTTWKPALAAPSIPIDDAVRRARWMVFSDENPLATALVERLRRAECDVVTVHLGEAFERLDAGRFRLAPGSREDYRRLVQSLDSVPTAIVHAWNLSDAEDLQTCQRRGYFSLLYLAQALASTGEANVRLAVLANELFDVSGAEAVRPEKATLLGPCKVVPQELAHVSLVCIDPGPIPSSTDPTPIVDRALAEIVGDAPDRFVALRGARRLVPAFEPVRFDAGNTPGKGVRDGGRYLITGAFGSVGAHLARHLAQSARARLVLVGRLPLPERTMWQEWLDRYGDDETSHRIRLIRDLESLGAEVVAVTANVADEKQMREAAAFADAWFGGLDGVLHAAGVTEGPSIFVPLTEIGDAETATQFESKVHGVLALDRALADRALDFRLLFSSNAAVLGGLGLVAYSAANLFMDAFASAKNARGDASWISANWDGWDLPETTEAARGRTRVADFSMSPGESVDAVRRIVACATGGQIVVSAVDMSERAELWLRAGGSRIAEGSVGGSGLHERPNLAAAYEAPRTSVERSLAGIWQDLLGVDSVGVDDNYFELGGHSLLATQMMSRVRESFAVELPIRTIFEAPTVAELAAVVDAAIEARRDDSDAPDRIVRAPRTGAMPLSFAQQRLWFLDQLEPDSPLYNVACAVRLRGALDVGVLSQSLDDVVRRHEVLRTRFAERDGEPVQTPDGVDRILVDVEYAPTDAAESPEAYARRRAREEARRPFDLATGPLVRVHLVRLSVDDHLFVFTAHHIVSDAWSMDVLVRELATLYGAFSAGRQSPLPDLDIQYADYAVWQRTWLTGQTLDTQIGYWVRQLAGLAPLDLPGDRPRPPVQTFRGATHRFEVERSIAEAVAALGTREGATLFMTLLTAFASLLHRYTGQTDLAVGSPVAGRSRREVEPLIGFFVNTLVLRIDAASDPAFVDLLGQVRETTLEAYAHQDLPFERLVEALQPERDRSRSPLFQVMFVLQNAPQTRIEAPGLALEPESLDAGAAKFDLTLFVAEGDAGLDCALEYNADLFDAESVERIGRHFANLLSAVARDPHTRLSRLDLLSPEERDRTVVDWNATRVDWPEDLCAHELFERQARRTPEAIAVETTSGERIAYGELDRRAARLAAWLRANGVTPDDAVGLSVCRSIEMAVGVLGILKAGAAYVPLDPEYPADRLAYMVRDCGATLVVADARAVRALGDVPARLFCFDADWAAAEACDEPTPPSGVGPAHSAYVIYTSGSTGWPKGVVMEHRALVNLIEWQRQSSTADRPTRTLQFASLSFDVSFQEMFSTWSAGGTLVLPGDAERADFAALAALLDRHAIERLFLPYVALQELAAEASRKNIHPRALREVVTAGEQLHVTPAIRSWFDAVRECRLVNQYGPSEGHVVTWHDLGRATGTWPTLPPIGRPIANARTYILDSELSPAPVGVAGELYTGGAARARGYLGRPALTAEKFLPDPFGPPGSRLYRTGDRARYTACGDIEFLGRADHQAKVRGYRVEPGEVEAALLSCEAVREAAVVVREDRPGEKRLVAYVVAGGDATDAEVRAAVRARLPDYMVPSAFVRLDALPVTASGKVDRRALPRPEPATSACRTGYVAPRTATEQTVARIWVDLLGVDRIGVEDDFFDLGGHSLLATRAVSRARDAFDVDVSLRALFEAPTLAGFAAAIDATRAARGGAAVAALVDEIGRLSPEQVRELLQQKRAGREGRQ